MCEMYNNAKLISTIYTLISIFVPIIFIIYYLTKNKKKRNGIRPYLYGLLIFSLFMGIKLILNLNVGVFECPRCYINNKCNTEEVSNKPTSTSTTTTTTKKIDKANKNNLKDSYEKVSEISGDKVDQGKTSKGYSIYTINNITYVDGYLIANKTYSLPEDFVPTDTVTSAVGKTNTCNDCINNTVYKAWKDMKADATAVGLSIRITSGYRPYSTQKTLYNRYVSRDGKAAADTYSARPGNSEHQTALCFDLNSISDAFANTNEGKWVQENAYLYGFIIRYPKGKTNETGYKYESWHLRYVGTDLSYKLYNNGDWITMEDYFGITSVYGD